jgi:hypothetical protein
MEGFNFVTPVTGLNRPNTGKEDDDDDNQRTLPVETPTFEISDLMSNLPSLWSLRLICASLTLCYVLGFLLWAVVIPPPNSQAGGLPLVGCL